MGIIRDSIVIYRDWADGINELPEENQLECYKALFAYGLNDEMPENLSPIAKGMLRFIRTQMESNKARYQASIENGKKGGRPKTQNNPDITQENPTETRQNPSITQENLDEPSPNLNEHVYEHDISLSRDINNSCGAGAREEDVDNLQEQRAFWKQHFIDFWKFNATNEERKSLALEVTDVIIASLRQTTSEERLTYNRHKYDYGELFRLFNGLTSEDFGKIVWSLQDAEGIKNRQIYILGALLNKANENKLAEERKHSLPKLEK